MAHAKKKIQEAGAGVNSGREGKKLLGDLLDGLVTVSLLRLRLEGGAPTARAETLMKNGGKLGKIRSRSRAAVKGHPL